LNIQGNARHISENAGYVQEISGQYGNIFENIRHHKTYQKLMEHWGDINENKKWEVYNKIADIYKKIKETSANMWETIRTYKNISLSLSIYIYYKSEDILVKMQGQTINMLGNLGNAY
jgi:hypothetical protein